MSQRALAKRSGVAQSTISTIESGRQQPSVVMLAKLIEATGFRIDARLVNAIRPSQLLADHRHEVEAVFARYPIQRGWVFGSVARGTDGPGSDLDLLVEFEAGTPFAEQVGLDDELSGVLGCRVDVVATTDLETNELFQRRVMRERKALTSAA